MTTPDPPPPERPSKWTAWLIGALAIATFLFLRFGSC